MSINIAHNLEDLAEGIGNLDGMCFGMSQNEYMDILLTAAFNKADRRFNQIAPLAAKAGDFTHMFEYNSTVYPGGKVPATTKPARLWETTLVGGGGRKTINFIFLPAKSPRTQVTSEETGGIDDDILAKLQVNNGKTYKWTSKAQDTETNAAILLRPQEGNKALFIPTIQGLNNATAKEKKQKFGFRKRYMNIPGEWTGGAGAFTTYFASFWATEGKAEMEAGMLSKFNGDVKNFNRDLAVSPSTPKPAQTANPDAAFKASTAKTRKQWTIKALSNDSRNDEGTEVIL